MFSTWLCACTVLAIYSFLIDAFLPLSSFYYNDFPHCRSNEALSYLFLSYNYQSSNPIWSWAILISQVGNIMKEECTTCVIHILCYSIFFPVIFGIFAVSSASLLTDMGKNKTFCSFSKLFKVTHVRGLEFPLWWNFNNGQRAESC